MAETQTEQRQNGHIMATPAEAGAKNALMRKRGPSIHQIYALPAPIRTFPLPTFYPNNPISLLAVAYAWLKQTIFPPSAEPSIIHQGAWSDVTGSVHVTDENSMRALWEQGFYGKGNLSRSEPNWLKREQVRRGQQSAHVSEVLTLQRRQERAQAKWERARLEQEAIRETRLKEAKLAEDEEKAKLEKLLAPSSLHVLLAPVGPLELLSLPNAASDLALQKNSKDDGDDCLSVRAPTQAINLPSPSNTCSAIVAQKDTATAMEEVDESPAQRNDGMLPDGTTHPSDCSPAEKTVKRRKSVRFSCDLEETAHDHAGSLSPDHAPNGKAQQLVLNGQAHRPAPDDATLATPVQAELDASKEVIVNREHLQLTPEEAFFLKFGFGALDVTEPISGRSLTTREMLTLFRQLSYFPPRSDADGADLGPDDKFLVHYAVYHHFRSLGWVPRAGIKFGVDWLLYTRGPVFDHAEFGLMVIPSYSDGWWKARGKPAATKSWTWLHSVVRILSHVRKSLVLIYVDVPPPPRFEAAMQSGFAEVLKLYKVREIMVKRWSSNRNR